MRRKRKMITNDFMAPVTDGKILPRGYSSISHLPGSKMIDDKDKLIGVQECGWLTVERRNFKDLVIITEKVDGMNASVYRIDNQLYPIIRAGYDVRTSDKNWIRAFGRFVSTNSDRFMSVLDNGERLCGEWMIKTHTLSYDLPHEPYVVFDIVGEKNKRLSYKDFRHRVDGIFTPTGLLHIGEAIAPLLAIEILGKGYHGVVGDQPEGVVYKYENQDGYVCSGKFVSHPDVGNEKIFTYNISNDIYNHVKSKYKQYLPNEND